MVPNTFLATARNSDTRYVTALDTRPTTFLTYPDDNRQALLLSSGGDDALAELEGETTLEWPVGGGVIVVVGQRADAHNASDTISLEMTSIPRWYNHRES